MLRILLQYLVPLLLPFLVYGAYVYLTRGRTPAWMDETPWLVLAAVGVGLMAVSLVGWGLMSGAPAESIYLPPRFEDGRVVPGRTIEDP